MNYSVFAKPAMFAIGGGLAGGAIGARAKVDGEETHGITKFATTALYAAAGMVTGVAAGSMVPWKRLAARGAKNYGVLSTIGGSLAGGAIGSYYGAPGTGMLIGAGVGAGGYGFLQGKKAFAGMSPGLKKAGAIGLTASAAAGAAYVGARMSEPANPVQYAQPDGAGGYEPGPFPSSVRDRMNRMNASGDLVFGLNNLR